MQAPREAQTPHKVSMYSKKILLPTLWAQIHKPVRGKLIFSEFFTCSGNKENWSSWFSTEWPAAEKKWLQSRRAAAGTLLPVLDAEVPACFSQERGCPGLVPSRQHVLATCPAWTWTLPCKQVPTGTKASSKTSIPSLCLIVLFLGNKSVL